jgi:predicted nucleic acid-binding protein
MKMRRVVVDTSIFIDFLRGAPTPRLEELLRENSALLSPLVRLELIRGMRLDEGRFIGDLLKGSPQVPHLPGLFTTAEALLEKLKRRGLTVGLIDLLLAAQARLLRCDIYSSDGVFAQIAKHSR